MSGEKYYIVKSIAGIPAGVEFPLGSMHELKPYQATLLLQDKGQDGYDLIIDYQFKSAYASISSVAFTIFGIRFDDNSISGQFWDNLFGECVFKNEKTAFETVSIRGSLSDSFVIEGLIRNSPFRLEVLSIETSADRVPSYTIEPVISEYMFCWEESILNSSTKDYSVIMTTDAGTVQFLLTSGSSWKKTFYGDGGGQFWGGFCRELEISSMGETIISLSGLEHFTRTVDDEAAPFHRTASREDWYLFSTRFGALEVYPYLHEEIEITL